VKDIVVTYRHSALPSLERGVGQLDRLFSDIRVVEFDYGFGVASASTQLCNPAAAKKLVGDALTCDVTRAGIYRIQLRSS
jgi:hypothetical protein